MNQFPNIRAMAHDKPFYVLFDGTNRVYTKMPGLVNRVLRVFGYARVTNGQTHEIVKDGLLVEPIGKIEESASCDSPRSSDAGKD